MQWFMQVLGRYPTRSRNYGFAAVGLSSHHDQINFQWTTGSDRAGNCQSLGLYSRMNPLAPLIRAQQEVMDIFMN